MAARIARHLFLTFVGVLSVGLPAAEPAASLPPGAPLPPGGPVPAQGPVAVAPSSASAGAIPIDPAEAQRRVKAQEAVRQGRTEADQRRRQQEQMTDSGSMGSGAKTNPADKTAPAAVLVPRSGPTQSPPQIDAATQQMFDERRATERAAFATAGTATPAAPARP